MDNLEEYKVSSEKLIGKLQYSVEEQRKKVLENEEELEKNQQQHKNNVEIMAKKNLRLEAEIEIMKERLCDRERKRENMKKICSTGMEKKMAFKGNLGNNMSSLNVKHQIKYPVNGGSALITFQKPSVAAQIISANHHKVNVEECWVNVKAEAVDLSVLEHLCMEMNLSPQKILVYNLPSDISQEIIMDKLEIFFGKTKNGGGEVEKREFLDDCRSAILTFIDKEVASKLVEKKFFHVPFGESHHEVCVAPSLEGILHDHKMRKVRCNRTVLITGIPDITDKDALRDLLEIYFQKPSNGGGDVQELRYCPVGQYTVALFEDDEDVPMTE